MLDRLKVSLIFLVKHKGKEHKYGFSLPEEDCISCDTDRLLSMLFDTGMQTAIIEVNKLINKESDG